MADTVIKPTFSKPISDQSKGYQKGFDKALTIDKVKLKESDDLNQRLNEIDGMLDEAEQSLKKKIFSLAKMEALVFSDPKLAAIYEEMAVNGEEKYGYHYNETIQNMIFNDYVLNSPKYLQKYKQAQPKEKKRRDKSGINQLKKKGEEMQTRNIEPKQSKPVLTKEAELEEMTGTGGAVGGAAFNGSGQYTTALGAKKVDETDSSSSGPVVGPAAWKKGGGDLLETGKKPFMPGAKVIQENKNYLIETEGFEEFFNSLNEADLSYQDKLYDEFKQSHTGSNKGMGVSEIPQSPEREKLEKGIDGNTSLYIGQDVDKMRDNDVKILHNDMTKEHSYFPHPENLNLPTDGIQGMGKNQEDNKIIDKTSAFTSDTVKGWNPQDTGTELDTLETGDPDKTNFKAMEEMKKLKEEAQSMIGDSPDTMANKPAPIGTQSATVDMGARSSGGGGMSESLNEISSEYRNDMIRRIQEIEFELGGPSMHTFEFFKDLPDEKIKEIYNELLKKSPSFQNKMGGLLGIHENFDLLEQINNELKAFAIHEEKLKKMTEDRKPSALVLKDRLGKDNQKNFKKDLKDSSISKLVDIENSLEYNDQQTEVKNPYELGEKLEKGEIKATDAKSGEGLKNVGDSANDEGDEIPKRNLSKEEQDEVNLYRLGLGDLVYDNEVGKRFEDRMKADMGDKLYQQRQDKLKFRAKAPMYNKDPQPVADTTSDKVQFNKEQTGWNEREGLKEGVVTGKYFDNLGKKKIIDFNLNEVVELSNAKKVPYLRELTLEGLGNIYTQVDSQATLRVGVNESAVKAIDKFKFYTDGSIIVALKNPVQNLSESAEKGKKVINEQMEKMKHLVGYNTATFIKQSKI